jgi:hypothetical protein
MLFLRSSLLGEILGILTESFLVGTLRYMLDDVGLTEGC